MKAVHHQIAARNNIYYAVRMNPMTFLSFTSSFLMYVCRFRAGMGECSKSLLKWLILYATKICEYIDDISKMIEFCKSTCLHKL